MLSRDSDYFYALQTQTGWGRTLSDFVDWCAPEPGWLTLDVGCGPGLLPGLLAQTGCHAVGVDIDLKMFTQGALHTIVAAADVHELPFESHTFDFLTASNLLFLLPTPRQAMTEMRRVLKTGGKVALLNPSEYLNVNAALAFAQQRGLEGLARNTLLNWAQRAEEHYRWTEDETRELYSSAGFKFMAGIIKVGPGFARFSWGTT